MTVLGELAALPGMTVPELKTRYESLFGRSPTYCTHAYLVKHIAYRLQEIAYGGISEAAHLKMNALLQKHGMEKDGFPPKGAKGGKGAKNSHRQILHPGTVLRREWGGEMHEVRAENNGYVWQGKTYNSLSQVAGEITGTNWNGPRFFGLRASPKKALRGGNP